MAAAAKLLARSTKNKLSETLASSPSLCNSELKRWHSPSMQGCRYDLSTTASSATKQKTYVSGHHSQGYKGGKKEKRDGTHDELLFVSIYLRRQVLVKSCP